MKVCESIRSCMTSTYTTVKTFFSNLCERISNCFKSVFGYCKTAEDKKDASKALSEKKVEKLGEINSGNIIKEAQGQDKPLTRAQLRALRAQNAANGNK